MNKTTSKKVLDVVLDARGDAKAFRESLESRVFFEVPVPGKAVHASKACYRVGGGERVTKPKVDLGAVSAWRAGEDAATKQRYVILKPKSSAQVKCLLELDEYIVQVAKANVSSWFDNPIESDMLDDYYKPVCQLDKKMGHSVRFALAKSDSIPAETDPQRADVALELQYIAFRRQSYTTVWKLAKFAPLESALHEDSDHESDDDRDDPEPAVEDIADLLRRASAAVSSAQQQLRARAVKLDQAAAEIDATSAELRRTVGLRAVQRVGELLDELGLDW